MDSYFPKTRRPKGGLSTPLKRPPPAISPPTAIKVPNTPTTPKESKIVRSLVPPAAPRKNALSRRVLDRSKPVTHRELFGTNDTTTSTTTLMRIHPHDQKELSATRTTEKPKPPKQSTLSRVAPSSPLKLLPLPSTPVPVVESQKSKPKQQLLQPKPTQLPESPNKIGSGPLKGISISLLEIIRSKEAAARLADPEQERKKELLGIAPEIVRIIPTVFTSSKKGIILYDSVVDKCFKGLKSNYTTSSITECLDLLERTVIPDWISTVTISKGKFMRINKDITKPQLLEAITRYKRQHLN